MKLFLTITIPVILWVIAVIWITTAHANYYAPDPCTVHVKVKVHHEHAIFSNLTDAAIFADKNHGQVLQFGNNGGQFLVEYVETVAESQLFDECS